MKINKRSIYQNIRNVPPIVRIPDDGWAEVSITQDSHNVTLGEEYRRSRFVLGLERVVQHRLQEEDAVCRNVSESFFMELYGDIIAQLHQIAHTARYEQRDKIIQDIDSLIEWIQEDSK